MKSSQEDIELLETYIKGRLSPEEKADFEVRLSKESDLNSDCNDLKILMEGMRVSVLEKKLDMLKNLENNTTAIVPNETKNDLPPFLSSKKIWLAGIIILFLAIFGWWMVNIFTNRLPKENESLFASRIDSDFILHKTERSTGITDSLSVQQRIAYDLFTIEEFAEAIPLLDSLWRTHHDTLAYFYLGLSYRVQGEKEKSQGILLDTILLNNPRFKSSVEKINK